MNENYNFIYPLAIIGISAFYFGKTCIKNGQEYQINKGFVIAHSILNAFLLYKCGFFNHFNWPQIIWLIMFCMGIAVILFETKKQEHKIGFSIFAYALLYFLYYQGGAFQYLN